MFSESGTVHDDMPPPSWTREASSEIECTYLFGRYVKGGTSRTIALFESIPMTLLQVPAVSFTIYHQICFNRLTGGPRVLVL